MIGNATGPQVIEQSHSQFSRWGHLAEVGFIVVLIFLSAGTPPPDVNEAHYLVKARHFWDSGCYGWDVFLDSADAHWVFYFVCGWPTLWCSLPAVTWCGRFCTWCLTAWAWQRLSWAVVPLRWVSVLSAAWFLALSSGCHLAGEWAVGGWEAKGLAYALVLFGLGAMLRNRWNWMGIAFGAAAALHVLVGGWSVVAAAIAWALVGPARPSLRSLWPGVVIGGALALLGVLPALWLNAGVDAATATEANLIYVFGRLPHHLVFHSFAPVRLVSFGLLMVAWLVLVRWGWRCEPWARLHCFALGALTIAVVGILLDLLLLSHPSLAAQLLRFYWFRLADVAVPLVVALALPAVLRQWEARRMPRIGWLWAVAVLLPALWLGRVYTEHQFDFRPGAIVQSSPGRGWTEAQRVARGDAWRAICAWIVEHADPHARFLTPRNQQTFKWYAQRAEVACWKDIPQDQASIVRWWRSLEEIYPPSVMNHGLGAWSDEQLRDIAQREQVDYILVDRAYTKRRLGFPRVYPPSPADEGWFELYRVARSAE